MNLNDLIIQFLINHHNSSVSQIHFALNEVSISSIKRYLTKLVENKIVEKQGSGKSTSYFLSKTYFLFNNITLDEYFTKDVDDRKLNYWFINDLLGVIDSCNQIFTPKETIELDEQQNIFSEKLAGLSKAEKNIEFERLAIDLSWKSSQIEGNTYSLLETEFLLKDKIEATGKSKLDAIMLLNHKEAIDFLLLHPDYLEILNVAKIIDIHRILMTDLGIPMGIRKRGVGITGTNFTPSDNQFVILEALENTCAIINKKTNPYEKAFLALLLIAYIQPFTDGNKRTSRIIANAILIANFHCPLSYRTVDPLFYKKAMLVFYEQNSIVPMKNIFIDQVKFAVRTYF